MGRPVDRIFEIRSGSGRSLLLRSVRATAIWVRDELEPSSLGWLVILEDVTDAARLERLSAWQEVARRVAHEIKNPLTPIQLSVDRLRRRLSPKFQDENPESVLFRECVGQIQRQVRVIRDLVQEFSQVAKLPEPKFEFVRVHDLLEALMQDYRANHPQIDFRIVRQGDLEGWLRADPEYLRRMVVNLLDNAVHSLNDAQTPHPRVEVLLRDFEKQGQSWWELQFRDNGPGIQPGLRDRIFDPYTTTKASGLGLGLPIVRRIVMEHQGRIRCEESHVGACFVVELPKHVSAVEVQS
jgi:two-component system nitrogen regulation sensor histidine kinase NtrY